MKPIKAWGSLAWDNKTLAHGWSDDSGGILRLRAAIYRTRAEAKADVADCVLKPRIVRIEIREVEKPKKGKR